MRTNPGLVALPVETADGLFIARYSQKGLAALEFPNGTQSRLDGGDAVSSQIQNWHHTTIRALAHALQGSEPRDLPPLDLSAGTGFQQNVWAALRRISVGKTLSYAEVAEKIGKPKATRAVGGACGANPIPVLVPCHRVLAANRRIGGFSGGLNWKRLLLGREGAILDQRISGAARGESSENLF